MTTTNTDKTQRYGRGQNPNSRNNLHKWRKGQSGNPKGAPSKDRQVVPTMKKLLGVNSSDNYKPLSKIELRQWDEFFLSATADELKAVAMDQQPIKTEDGNEIKQPTIVPMYARATAAAILIEMKQGQAKLLHQIRQRLYPEIVLTADAGEDTTPPLIQIQVVKDASEVVTTK